MNKEILFRAKKLYTNKWEFSECISTGLEENKLFFHYGRELEWTEMDKETLGQYIGKEDMDGNKIFTGDIVFYNNKKYEIWDEYIMLILPDSHSVIYIDYDNVKVVGSIYDDVELNERNKQNE